MTDIFLQLLRVALGKQEALSRTATDTEWEGLLEMSVKQTLVGVTFAGIERLPSEQRPPKKILLRWYAIAEKIKTTNSHLNKECANITAHFSQRGMYSCILKGQGNALLYPRPEFRTPGDIDIWLWPKDIEKTKGTLNKRREKIVSLIRKDVEPEHIVYHHVDYKTSRDTEVEVHFTPTWLHNPFKNDLLQRFIEDESYASFNNSREIGGGECFVPTWELNVVTQMIHMQHHLFQEGIGLRQILDFYYLLHVQRGIWADNKHINIMKRLGLMKFASGIMWILQECLDKDNSYLLTKPDKKLGKFIFNEIFCGGNFGKYHKDYRLSNIFTIRVFQRIQRSWKFFRINPHEAVYIPWFKAWHFFKRIQWRCT